MSWVQVTVAECNETHKLEVKWQKGHHSATLKADLQGMSFEILATRGKGDDDTKTISYKLGQDDCSEAQDGASPQSLKGSVKWEHQEVEVCTPVR